LAYLDDAAGTPTLTPAQWPGFLRSRPEVRTETVDPRPCPRDSGSEDAFRERERADRNGTEWGLLPLPLRATSGHDPGHSAGATRVAGS